VKIEQTSFKKDEYPSTLDIAVMDDLILIGNDLEQMKKIIQFYLLNQGDNDKYKTLTTISPIDLMEQASDILPKNIGTVLEQTKLIKVLREDENRYKFRLEY
jgi:hypothetical protein